MNSIDNLKAQRLELEELLREAAGDVVLTPQLEYRLQLIDQEIDGAERSPGELFAREPIELPRAALFLRGGGVVGDSGIRPSLAGEALIQYEKMFVEQAIHDERMIARAEGKTRRPKGATPPALLLTGTPRGSFGLEFVPQPTDDSASLKIHAESLRNVADALVLVGESNAATLNDSLASVPPRVLRPLKRFFNVLATHRAELRLSFPDHGTRSLTADQIEIASFRLEQDVREEELALPGLFRGITP